MKNKMKNIDNQFCRYYDAEGAGETDKRSSNGSKRRSEESRTRKNDERSDQGIRTSIDTSEKYDDGQSPRPLKEFNFFILCIIFN